MQQAVARLLRRIFFLRQIRAEVLHVAPIVRVCVDVVRLETEIHRALRIAARLQSRLQPDREAAHRIASVARGKFDVRPIRQRLEAPQDGHRGPRDERTIRIVPRARAGRAARVPAREPHRPGRPFVRIRWHCLRKLEPLDLVAIDLEDPCALDREAEFPILHRTQIAREPVAAGELHRGIRLLRRGGFVAAEDDPLHILRREAQRRRRVRALPGELALAKCRELAVELRAVGEFEHLIARGVGLRGLVGFLGGSTGEHHPAIHDLHALGLLRRAVVKDVAVKPVDDPDLLRTARHRGECSEHGHHRGEQRAGFHQRSWFSVRKSEGSGSSARSKAAPAPCRCQARGPRPSSRHHSACPSAASPASHSTPAKP